ncbi:MAG: DPP IV N-terminal domain-containing protein, partial [Acidobacteria bacterium]|nr:DPP IV N-terminal domain-containing protein [Acidobacteriota bacterium]
LLVQIYSLDNKDRWIATVDFEQEIFEPIEHFFDEAWINGGFSSAGWLPDSRRFYFLSEESGYSHLYLQSLDGRGHRALTEGRYVVSPRGSNPRPLLTRDGRTIYFTANREHPGEIEVYRVAVDSGTVEQLTDLGGVTSFELSPDEETLLLRHSTTSVPDGRDVAIGGKFGCNGFNGLPKFVLFTLERPIVRCPSGIVAAAPR